MRIFFKKNQKVLCGECEIAADLSSQLRGLMFSRKRNILFVFDSLGQHPIHSFFVFFPFYAIYLDEKMRIVDLHFVKPFTPLVKSRKPARYLIEISKFSLKGMPKVGGFLCWDGKYSMKENTKQA